MTDRWEISKAVRDQVMKAVVKGRKWSRRRFHSDDEGLYVRFDGFRVWTDKLELMLGESVVGTVHFPDSLGPEDSCTIVSSKDVRGLLKFTIL